MQCRSCSAAVPPSARYCSWCGAPAEPLSEMETERAPAPADGGAPDDGGASPPVNGSWPTDRSADKFLPGTVLSRRYRIVSLLGRGGMGVVFRAEDMRLGQTVALKFLPRELAGEPELLARLHEEVRVARRVAHPHVCRVYDIGDADGDHFLTMEYIEGETLATLIRRIGRLPEIKAVQIAHQMATGLAAAHSRGVLHRDFKPGNVMIDERGMARITDFGLAAFSEDVARLNATEGTPAYMAPEQLEGKAASTRSDIYALGLTLYELFTGASAFDASDLVHLLAQRARTPTPMPSELAPDIDPAIERLILGCLERDPARRPASALAVAAALPGGDPLAAAIAAGETPSPDLLIAAADDQPLPLWRALVALACVLVGAVSMVLDSRTTALVSAVPLPKSPAALRAQARAMARDLGYLPSYRDASGFVIDWQAVDAVQIDGRWADAARRYPPLIYFWYRVSPTWLVPVRTFSFGRASLDDPPQRFTGDLAVRMRPDGRLLEFAATTPEIDRAGTAAALDPAPLFRFAGLDLARFRPLLPERSPAAWGDARAAWRGPAAGTAPGQEVTVEVAANHGKPIAFSFVAPGMAERDFGWLSHRSAEAKVYFVAFLILLAATLVLARRHLRSGRGDRRGAARLSLTVLGAELLIIVLGADHALDAAAERRLLTAGAAAALLVAATLWLIYLAVEPYARRWWPRMFITWNRLLSLRLDARVASDLLVGLAAGFAGETVRILLAHVDHAGSGRFRHYGFDLDVLLGPRHLLTGLIRQGLIVVAGAFAFVLILVVLRVLTRRDRLAALAFALLYPIAGSILDAEHWWIGLLLGTVLGGISLWLMFRVGVLALMAWGAPAFVRAFPLTTSPSAWLAGPSYAGLLVVLLLAGWAFYRAVGAGRLFERLLAP